MVTRPPDPVGGDEARRAAETVLRQDEYQHDRQGIVSRVLHWITSRLGDLLGGGGGGGSAASHAVLVLVVVLLAVAIVFAVRAGVPRRAVRAVGRSDASDPLAPVDAAEHRRRALEHTTAGRLDEALREWLRAAIATIEERGVLAPRPGRTGAQTAAEAGPVLPAAAIDLAAATRAFDEVWFGARAATDADVARARRAADAVTSTRISRSAHSPAGIAVPW